MDNYKIINTHTNEIIKALSDLGYVWTPKKFDEQDCLLKAHWILAKETGEIAYSSGTHIDSPLLFKELTLPQLRDLVAQSKSNLHEYLDPNDNYKLCLINSSEAAHWMIEVPEGADCLMQWPTGHKVFYRGNFAKSWNSAYREWQFVSGDDGIDQSSTLWKRATQDPALISGAEALRALADGKDVDVHESTYKNEVWFNLKDTKFTPAEILAEKVRDKPYTLTFRLKPQTIKLELELPKPFEPEEDCHVYILDDGKTDGYRRYSYEVHGDKGNTFIGIWRTEEEIKQVVEQLRKIRGTNS